MKTLGQGWVDSLLSIDPGLDSYHYDAANAVRDEVIRRIRENIAEECIGDFDLAVHRAFDGEVVPSLSERPELAAVNKLRADIVAAMRKYESAPMLRDMADTIARGGLAF